MRTRPKNPPGGLARAAGGGDVGACANSRASVRSYRRWEPSEDRQLRALYPDSLAQEIAQALGREIRQVYARARALGLRKSQAFLSSERSGRLSPQTCLGRGSRFKPGQQAWNKGTRGLSGTQEACRRTQFKAGSRPHNWVPVGSYRVTSQGVLEVKYSESKGSPSQRWKPVARVVWEAAYGAVPTGMCVAFKPGCASSRLEEITLDKLQCVHRGDLMRRNGIHSMANDLVEIVRLRATLTRVCNEVSKRERPQTAPHEEEVMT